jgi:hypothetical protein
MPPAYSSLTQAKNVAKLVAQSHPDCYAPVVQQGSL